MLVKEFEVAFYPDWLVGVCEPIREKKNLEREHLSQKHSSLQVSQSWELVTNRQTPGWAERHGPLPKLVHTWW